MNDIDDLIKRELEKETSEIDELMVREGGLPDMVSAAFKGSMRRWVWLMSLVTLVFTALLVWCGYEFYIAQSVDDRVFGGLVYRDSNSTNFAQEVELDGDEPFIDHA